MVTIVLTSARVAPGLLSWPAWDALHSASRVLVGSAGHPQLPALAGAGVAPEIVAAPPDPAGLAALLLGATAGSDGPVVWLAAAGEEASPALLDALSAAGPSAEAAGEVRVLHGSRDLPGAHVIDVAATMATLRASCPWDRQQTHASLAPHLIEESYEALDALEQGDHQALREELGDVLLQVAFHAVIAAERGTADGGYTIDDIADTLVAKLVRRHPHVFGDVSVGSADEVTRNWDEIKKAERAAKLAAAGADMWGGSGGAGPATPSVLDGIVLGQPALSLAAQVLRRAARAGYPVELVGAGADDGPDGDGPDLGSQLFRLVARAREAGLDPEAALRVTVRAHMARIHDSEQSATLRWCTVKTTPSF
jgi:MazG family protein